MNVALAMVGDVQLERVEKALLRGASAEGYSTETDAWANRKSDFSADRGGISLTSSSHR
jgi:hypothetical protein